MTTILIKKKDTAGAPAPGDLTNAAGGTEIAVNTATKRIYTKDAAGNVVELGTNAASSTIDQLTVVTSTTLSYGTANQVQYLNASKLLVGSANLTFNGTTLVANDITDSSLTAGRVTYAGTAGNLTDSANLLFSGTSLSITGTTAGASVTQLTLRNNDDTASTASRLALQPTTTSGRGGYIEAINLGTSGQPSVMTFAVNAAAAAATEQMRLTTTGLGIGTSSPARTLDVYGSIQAADASGIQSVLWSQAISGAGGIGTNNNYPFAFLTNGSERMRIDSTGLGIGTISPTQKLDVVLSSATAYSSGITGNGLRLYNTSTTTGQYVGITFQGEPTAGNGGLATIMGTTTGSGNMDLTFSTRSSATLAERMRITSAGNVGIGTTTPSDLLQVVSATVDPYVTIGNGNGRDCGLKLNASTGFTALRTDASNPLYISSGTGFMMLSTNGSERMRITATGNVGIGVAAPASRLQVYGGTLTTLTLGNGTANDYSFLRAESYPQANNGYTIFSIQAFSSLVSTSVNVGNLGFTKEGAGTDNKAYFDISTHDGTSLAERLRITAAGNVGIGTSSPADTSSFGRAIDIQSAGGAAVYMRASGTNPATEYFTVGYSPTAAYLYNRANTPMYFYTNATERMRITATGDLLIGTSSWSSGSNGISIGGNSNSRILITNSTDYGIEIYGATSSRMAFSSSDGSSTRVGSITVSTVLTTYNTTSDYRLKNVTGSLAGYKERLMSLQPKQGTWITDGSEFRGFVAHEFANPYRSSVSGEKDAVDADGKPVMQSMQASSSEVMADLVALIQEQQAIIESLKARLDAANL